MRARVLPLLAAAAIVLHSAGPASAAWDVGGTGTSRADAAVLAAPSDLAVSWDPTVHLSWKQSASSWTGGYRIWRSVAASGPFTQIAAVPASTTKMDDSPGAGTHYYTVRAYREAWTSPASNTVARSDPRYVIKAGSEFTGTNCAGADVKLGMQQGHAPTGTATPVNLQKTSFVYCTDVFTTGQSQPAGTTTVTAYVTNTGSTSCDVRMILTVNGTTELGRAIHGVPPTGTTVTKVSWSFPTSGASFATGDRVNLSLAQVVNGCPTKVDLYSDGANAPSAVTLPQ
jgi:hypothetical protein